MSNFLFVKILVKSNFLSPSLVIYKLPYWSKKKEFINFNLIASIIILDSTMLNVLTLKKAPFLFVIPFISLSIDNSVHNLDVKSFFFKFRPLFCPVYKLLVKTLS